MLKDYAAEWMSKAEASGRSSVAVTYVRTPAAGWLLLADEIRRNADRWAGTVFPEARRGLLEVANKVSTKTECGAVEYWGCRFEVRER